MNELGPAVSHAIYDAFADYYDVSDIDRRPEIAFYQRLVRKDDRRLLDLGCGTGTITVDLADQIFLRHGSGARIVGVDQSARMLEIARTRAPTIEWVQGDMRDPPIQGSFDLVLCPFNTLQLLLSDADLVRTFRAVRKFLGPNGLFAFDIFQPNLEYLNSPLPDRVVRSFADRQGRVLSLRESFSYDATSAVLTVHWSVVDPQNTSGEPIARLLLNLRQYFPSEVEHLLRTAGLQIRERFGDTHGNPFTPQSKKQVILASAK